MRNLVFVLIVLLLGYPQTVVGQGRKNGTVKEFDGQGRLRAVLKYREDILLRKKLYNNKGILLLDTVYRNGAPVMIKSYYPTGQLKSSWSKKTREARFYYPTGNHKVTVPVIEPAKLDNI